MFDLTKMTFESILPIEVEVELPGLPCILRECPNKMAIKYKDALAKATKMVNGKFAGTDGIAGTEALLVSYCLWDVTLGRTKDKIKPVPLTTILEWPNGLVSELFERARDISRLKPKNSEADIVNAIKELQEQLDEMRGVKEDPSKNSSNGTTHSSSSPPSEASASTESSGSDGG